MVAAGLLFCAFFYSFALGWPTAHDTLHVHEKRSDVPSTFKYVGEADPSAMLDLRIALVQSDLAGLEAALYDVSTPGSKNYRQHLTKAQVRMRSRNQLPRRSMNNYALGGRVRHA